MNGAPNSTVDGATSKPARKLGRFELSIDWLLRPLFGVALATLAIAVTWYGHWFFAAFLAVGAIAGAREWHRIFLRQGYAGHFAVSALSIGGALAAQVALVNEPVLPWALLALGAVLNLGLFAPRDALWHALASLYVGFAPLSLLVIRGESYGFWIVMAVYIAVWATDTGALFSGSLIGGPKLWPKLSPNKTWAGAFGGALSAVAGTCILFAVLRANVLNGALFGLAMSAVGQVGDLFESWIKRRVGRKNSGSLIPGHGGVLDRIDSILFVAPLVALAIVQFGINPFGAP